MESASSFAVFVFFGLLKGKGPCEESREVKGKWGITLLYVYSMERVAFVLPVNLFVFVCVCVFEVFLGPG